MAKQVRPQGSGAMIGDSRPKPSSSSQQPSQPKNNPLPTNTSTVAQIKPKPKVSTTAQTAPSTSLTNQKQAQSLLKSAAQRNKQNTTAKSTLEIVDDDDIICID